MNFGLHTIAFSRLLSISVQIPADPYELCLSKLLQSRLLLFIPNILNTFIKWPDPLPFNDTTMSDNTSAAVVSASKPLSEIQQLINENIQKLDPELREINLKVSEHKSFATRERLIYL
jgi:hypothetical protein